MQTESLLLGVAALVALAPLVQLIINAINLGRSKSKDDKSDGAQSATVLVELGTIKGGVEDIKAEQRQQAKTNIEVLQRLTAAEESVKQAHKRIDHHEAIERQDGGTHA